MVKIARAGPRAWGALAVVVVLAGAPGEVRADHKCLGCHMKVAKGTTVHAPIVEGKCVACHRPKGKLPKKGHPKRFFTRVRGNAPCLSCHKKVAKLVRGKQAHAPVEKKGCTYCHQPHSTKTSFLLKSDSVAKMCYRCHKKPKKVKWAHGPMAAEACTACHSPHGSPVKSLLLGAGEKLCFRCHDRNRFKPKHKHKALDKGCPTCHMAHGGNNKFFVRKPLPALCGQCHQKILKIAKTAKHKHKALVMKARCANCHDPHGSKYLHLMRDHMAKVCTSCHVGHLKGKYKHGPVRDGDCGACHQPHGGKNPRMLVEPFPKEFYGPFSPDRYALCFQCHESDITKDKYTVTLTSFRKGNKNLHYTHVVAPGGNRLKGRSCKACHQVHSGTQPKQIRTEVPFGVWKLPVRYTKTKNGGRCVVGCHNPRSYDRTLTAQKKER